MIKFIKKYKISIIIVFLVCVLVFLTFLPKLKTEHRQLVVGIDYGNLKDLESLPLKYDYKIENINLHKSFTLEENYVAFQLNEVLNFNEVHYFNVTGGYDLKIELSEGKMPNAIDEMIIPLALKEEYKINDKLLINTGNLLGIDTTTKQEELVGYSTQGFVKDTFKYEDESSFKEFTIVGYYTSDEDDYIKDMYYKEHNDRWVGAQTSSKYLEIPVFTILDKVSSYDSVTATISHKSYSCKIKNSRDIKTLEILSRRYYDCGNNFCYNGIKILDIQ